MRTPHLRAGGDRLLLASPTVNEDIVDRGRVIDMAEAEATVVISAR